MNSIEHNFNEFTLILADGSQYIIQDMNLLIDKLKSLSGILVCYNAAEIFHILLEYMGDDDFLYELVDSNNLRDIMLMDSLINLAIGTGNEIEMRPKIEITQGRGIIETYECQITTAKEITKTFPEINETVIKKYGYLTEYIQVKGSIALKNISKNGMQLDHKQYHTMVNHISSKYDECLQLLKDHPDYCRIFGKNDSINEVMLNDVLTESINEMKRVHNIDVDVPKKDGILEKNHYHWKRYARFNKFIKYWTKLKRYQYYRNVLENIDSSEKYIHAKYKYLTVNGKTSSFDPPIQKFPTKPGYREIFKARDGYKFMIIDYDFIELCTLARICEIKYGFSKLGETIKNGIDPHSYTASILLGIDYETFIKNKENPNEKYYRVISKAINFGLTGGQSTNGLMKYARQSFGIHISPDEATIFRDKLINEIYPELKYYLEDTTLKNMANSFEIEVSKLSSFNKYSIMRILKGKSESKHMWDQLIDLCRNEKLKNELIAANYIGSKSLADKILGTQMTILTGRVRNNVGYTTWCNTMRAGIAADGAKLAMWNIMYSGYRIVAFIHDELIIEIPECEITAAEKIIPELFCRSMEEFNGDIPVSAKYKITETWIK